jgi:uncharacterized protein YbaR (Trm112 family)
VIDARLLDIVVCPSCRSALTPVPDAAAATELHCTGPNCGLRYPVRDGVPVLLVEEAHGGHDDVGTADEGEAGGDGVERAD